LNTLEGNPVQLGREDGRQRAVVREREKTRRLEGEKDDYEDICLCYVLFK